MNDFGLDQNDYNSKWDLVQFFFLATYTVGFYGTTALPFYVEKYTALFFVAYYILLILICIPVCYIQIKLGAVYRYGIVGIFSHLVPILKGGAVALLCMTYTRCLISGLELSYGLYFSFVSFDSYGSQNTSIVRPTEYQDVNRFFHEDFLQISSGITEQGHVIWYLLLCLLATWIVIYLLTFKGTAFFGKCVYGLTTTAFILLLIVLVYGRLKDNLISFPRHYKTLSDGVIVEIKEVKPITVVSLGSPEVWVDALLLHMNSVGLWSGVLPTLGTRIYNKKSVIHSAVALLIIAYSIFPAVTFLALQPYYDMSWDDGFLSLQKGIKPGMSYLFLGVFSTVRHHPVIALFVFMFCFLFGLVHLVMHMCMIWDTVLPSIPKIIMKRLKRREVVVAIACLLSFLLSLPLVAQGGLYVYTLINSYVDRLIFTVIIVSIVPFITGYLKQESLYLPVERIFMGAWYGLASLIPSGMLIYYFAVNVYPYSLFGYDEKWVENIGWVIASLPLSLSLVCGAVHAIWNGDGDIRQKCLQALKPDSLPSTDSFTDDNPETDETACNTKSPNMDNRKELNLNKEGKIEKSETEIVMRPPDFTEVAKV